MNRMRGKGHAGGHKDTVPVTLAALRHDDLSVFMFQSVPSYYISFSFHSVVFVKVVLRNSERSHLRCLRFYDSLFMAQMHRKIEYAENTCTLQEIHTFKGAI